MRSLGWGRSWGPSWAGGPKWCHIFQTMVSTHSRTCRAEFCHKRPMKEKQKLLKLSKPNSQQREVKNRVNCSFTKVSFFSESANCSSNLQKRYFKSLSWTWNLNFPLITVNNLFKFQVQDRNLEYFFWQCEKHIALSEKRHL